MAVFVGDTLLVSFRGLAFGQRVIFTHTYKCKTASPSTQTLLASMDEFMGQIGTNGLSDLLTPYSDCLGNSYNMTEVRLQLIFPTRFAYFPYPQEVPGTAGAITVANDAAAITMRTQDTGRNQVATKHIGPVPDNASVAGLLTAAYKLKLNDLGSKLTNGVILPSGTEWLPVIFHRETNTSSPIFTHAIGDQSRTQRRRTVGLGE